MVQIPQSKLVVHGASFMQLVCKLAMVSKQSMQLLLKVESTLILCNRSKPKTVAGQAAKMLS